MSDIDSRYNIAYGTQNPATARNSSAWIAYLAGALTFIVVLAGGGVIAGDWIQRNVEMKALVTAVQKSESQMSQAQVAVSAAFTTYGGLKSPVAADREALVKELANVAGTSEQAIAQAGAQVAAVPILPWHTSILAAQQAYVTHNMAWQKYLGRAAKDPMELTVPQPEVNDTFAAVQPAMTAAVPVPALFELVATVRQIFIDGAPAPDPGTDPGTESGPTESVSFAGLLPRLT